MNPLEIEPDLTQKLTEIGARLREARQAQDTSLEEISGKTMIPTRLLSAIEEGRVDSLPEAIYTRGFIRRFGDSVGLNGPNLADVYSGNLSQDHLETETKTKQRKKRLRGLRGGLRPVHLYVLYIALIMSAGVGLSYLTNPSAITSTGDPPASSGAIDAPSEPTAPENKANAQQGTSSKPVAAPTATKPDLVRVDLSIKEASWMEIIVDGEVSYEGILSPGTNKTVVAKEQLVITAGNAGGVMLAVNKQPAQLMGEPGAIKELKLKPETLASQST
ncbi:helix-turn-helix domain-containing protein [Acaryochloris sp. IP29b_bin.137]|uniref:helix-turn-helix domain-containing protein n=1 Tax=Acaryochloris sp. IP29b_bin.137 TaxID=2969217 RepID=UPI0026196AEB|nr:helix-turn-helix domain-containing protein [Acaryochloris sp. IP29b_bin.137]